jgi:hypothetical protein
MNVRGIAMVPSRSRFSPRLLPSTETQLSVWMFLPHSDITTLSPEACEPIRRERRVAHRRGNGPVAEMVLDRARVLASQLMTAALPQHLTLDEERKAWSLASTSHHALITGQILEKVARAKQR